MVNDRLGFPMVNQMRLRCRKTLRWCPGIMIDEGYRNWFKVAKTFDLDLGLQT